MIKKTLLFTLCLFISFYAIGQNTVKAKEKVKEGYKLHKAQKYDKAIKAYTEALEADKNNLLALSEMAMTYIAIKDYKQAIKLCKKAIAKNANSNELANVYVQLGTAYDLAGKGKKAVKLYNKGIELFPSYYMLYFNKGITQMGLKDFKSSLMSFQTSAQENPEHPSSHYYIGLIEDKLNHKIPAIMALSRFLVLENNSKRSAYASLFIRRLVGNSMSKNKYGGITINMSSLKEKKYDDFSMIEMMMSISAANQLVINKKLEDSLGIKLTEAQKFLSSYDKMCSLLSDTDKIGFYWTYYAPYFSEMKKQDHTEVMTYLIHVFTKDNGYVKTWIDENDKAIDIFSKWNTAFEW